MSFFRFFLLWCCCFYPCYQLTAQQLTVVEALKQARQYNPTLKISKYNAALVAADSITAGLKPNPAINFQVLQLASSSTLPAGANLLSREARQFWSQLTKQFQVKNQRQNKIDFAKQNYALAELLYANEERNLYFIVANQWLDTWILQKRVQIIAESQANIDTLVKINQNRLKNEVITRTELVRTQILSQQFDAQLLELQRNYYNNLQVLRFLTGVKDSISIAEGQFMDMDIAESNDSLVAHALNNRIDGKITKHQIKIAESNVRLQQSLAYPRPELGVLWNPQNAVPYVGIYATFPLPIFDKNQGEIQKAKISVQQAQTVSEVFVLQLDNEIKRAYFDYETQKLKLQKFKQIVEQSQQVLATIRYAYLRGNTTIIDFLDAQRTLYNSQQDYNDALYQMKQSYINLLFVTGKLEKLVE